MDQYYSPLAQVVILLFLGKVTQTTFTEVLKYWKEAAAQEWMIVLKNGEMKTSGVGLKTFIWPGETCITFPSKLRQVTFTAEQVTQEMQGVAVTGMLVWSVYREDDGPFKCYKSFGDDLKRNSNMANEKMMNLSKSIIRDRIANMSINEIIRNRAKLRDGVREEIQKLITGWGIWLETIEILDVQIASNTLFKNLQTEFREKTRQEAETISATISNELRNEELERNKAISTLEQTYAHKRREFEDEQNIGLKRVQGKIFEEQTEIDVKMKDLENSNLLHEQQQNNKFKNKVLELTGQHQTFVNKQNIKEQNFKRDLNKVSAATSTIRTDFNHKKESLEKNQELAHLQQELEIKSKLCTENLMKKELIDTVQSIYSNIKISEFNVVNVGNGNPQNESAGAVLGQIMNQYSAIAGAVKR